jgi:putative two-component system response regulator
LLELNTASHPDSRILVVDDNPVNLLFLQKLLKKAGYENVEATTRPEDAEQMALLGKPDLAIIDLHMPGMDGYELLARLRAQKIHTGYLPILVFTADVGGDARRRALELGATDFLTKPGDPSEITLRVRNFLEMRYLYRQLEDQNEILERKVQERTQRLREAQLEMVNRLALAGDYRDDDTGEHCRRVGEISYRIAIAYGVSPDEADLIRVAAPLHDIGKVGISDSILKKPERLNEHEFAEIRRHVNLGASILANSTCDILQMAHVIALSHHERWDGKGYGSGYAGEQIPLPGRIVAVADVYDALTHRRPYKDAWTESEAVAEIQRLAGTHFDPAVVDAFVRAVAAVPVAA